MTITIQDTDKHEDMLSSLKSLTGKETSSEALIEGGYCALKYKQLYEAEVIKNQELEKKIQAFLSSRLS